MWQLYRGKKKILSTPVSLNERQVSQTLMEQKNSMNACHSARKPTKSPVVRGGSFPRITAYDFMREVYSIDLVQNGELPAFTKHISGKRDTFYEAKPRN